MKRAMLAAVMMVQCCMADVLACDIECRVKIIYSEIKKADFRSGSAVMGYSSGGSEKSNTLRGNEYKLIDGLFPRKNSFVEFNCCNSIDGSFGNNEEQLYEAMLDEWNKGKWVGLVVGMQNPVNLKLRVLDDRTKQVFFSNLKDNMEKSNVIISVVHLLLKLQKQGVVVLIRPFHEMNAPWYWWGRQNLKPVEYSQIWRTLYHHLSDNGIRNLIWIYSVDSENGAVALETYPGDDVVDIVGVDYYGSLGSANARKRQGFVDALEKLSETNKPMAITELGGMYNYKTKRLEQCIDYGLALNFLKKTNVKLSYVMFWGGPYGPLFNKGFNEVDFNSFFREAPVHQFGVRARSEQSSLETNQNWKAPKITFDCGADG